MRAATQFAGLHRAAVRMGAWVDGRSPRERALLMVAGAALSIGLCGEMAARLSDARDAASEIRAERVRLERRLQVERTPAYVASADESARAARTASIGGETIFAARARAQAMVAEAARAAGVDDASVSLEDRPDEASAVEPVVMQVDGAYDVAAFGAFLMALSEAEQSFSPTDVDVSGASGDGRFRMGVMAYALTMGAAP